MACQGSVRRVPFILTRGGQEVKLISKLNERTLGLALKSQEILKSKKEMIAKDRGATAVEYALLVGLIAAAIILAVIFLGDTIEGIFKRVGSTISSNT